MAASSLLTWLNLFELINMRTISAVKLEVGIFVVWLIKIKLVPSNNNYELISKETDILYRVFKQVDFCYNYLSHGERGHH